MPAHGRSGSRELMGTSQVKMELDRLVARRTGWSIVVVREVTAAFLDITADQLVRRKEIILEKLGRFRVFRTEPDWPRILKTGRNGGTREVVVKRHIKVSFSKSVDLKRRLEKHDGKARRG